MDSISTGYDFTTPQDKFAGLVLMQARGDADKADTAIFILKWAMRGN